MPWLLLIILVLAVVFGPSLWAKAVLAHHADDRPDYPGTGGELARHLLDRAGLEEVAVERTDRGDHYDPEAKAVRLTPGNLDGRSLTAVTAATHEVGHALQDRDGYGPLATRTRLVKSIGKWQRIGSIIIFATFGLGLASASPSLAAFGAGAGVATMASAVIIHHPPLHPAGRIRRLLQARPADPRPLGLPAPGRHPGGAAHPQGLRADLRRLLPRQPAQPCWIRFLR
jgi:Zn-dependent membrane protease YugP